MRNPVSLDPRRNVLTRPNVVEIRGNTYFRNYAGKGQGILDIRGLAQTELVSENFTRNGENTIEAVVQMSDARFRHVFTNVGQNNLAYNLTFNALLNDFT